MAVLLSRSVFFHTPKTGGQWVADVLQRGAQVQRVLEPVHLSPDELCAHHPDCAGLPRFCFIRHPMSWYRSMWAHRMDEAWDAIDAPEWFTMRWIARWEAFTACRSADFETFVLRVLDRFPDGFVSTLFDEYCTGATFIGRQERLAADLQAALMSLNEPLDVERLATTEARNVRAAIGHRARQTKPSVALCRRVAEVEADAFRRFDYDALSPVS